MVLIAKALSFGVKTKFLLHIVLQFWAICAVFVGIGLIINAAAEKCGARRRARRSQQKQ